MAYQALKITEPYRQPLTQANIVICTAITDNGEADVIDIAHANAYPDFEVVTCYESQTDADIDDLIASYLEGNL